MVKISALHFHPKRVRNIGLMLLASSFGLCVPFVVLLYNSDSLYISSNIEQSPAAAPFSFSLGVHDQGVALPIPKIQDELTFFLTPPRPDGAVTQGHLLVRLKKGLDCKRVTLPCRFDLEFQEEKLQFAKGKSLFWVEVDCVQDQRVEGKWYVNFVDKMESGPFVARVEEPPIQSAVEFGAGTPFRLLADAKWLGQDLLKKGAGERLEVDSVSLEVDEYLSWKGGKWEKGAGRDLPIARIVNATSKGIILEGWDANGYVRLCIPSAMITPFKVKAEELFSSIRIRSEKQISCTLEKQCMVLKTGDWVLKTGGRWKILRKKEEREAFLNGKLSGELFIFEQILQKAGQKIIQGRMFNPSRTQVAPIEVAATVRKGAKR